MGVNSAPSTDRVADGPARPGLPTRDASVARARTGWPRRRRTRAAPRDDPASESSAKAAATLRDVVEPALGDLSNARAAGRSGSGYGSPRILVRREHRLAVAGEEVGEGHRARGADRASTTGVEREQSRRHVADRRRGDEVAAKRGADGLAGGELRQDLVEQRHAPAERAPSSVRVTRRRSRAASSSVAAQLAEPFERDDERGAGDRAG